MAIELLTHVAALAGTHGHIVVTTISNQGHILEKGFYGDFVKSVSVHGHRLVKNISIYGHAFIKNVSIHGHVFKIFHGDFIRAVGIHGHIVKNITFFHGKVFIGKNGHKFFKIIASFSKAIK